MAKQRERSEVEALRAEVRNLKKQVAYYKKELGRLSKRSHLYNDLEDRIREEELEKEKPVIISKKTCPKCKKDSIKITDLGTRKLLNCQDCGFRKSEK